MNEALPLGQNDVNLRCFYRDLVGRPLAGAFAARWPPSSAVANWILAEIRLISLMHAEGYETACRLATGYAISSAGGPIELLTGFP